MKMASKDFILVQTDQRTEIVYRRDYTTVLSWKNEKFRDLLQFLGPLIECYMPQPSTFALHEDSTNNVEIHDHLEGIDWERDGDGITMLWHVQPGDTIVRGADGSVRVVKGVAS